ncbi:MAG: thiamine phosphate synthase [Gemmatimonadetes bacterium]|nr:thiamine phosphate synthase [Gemmatimonadota bacterium]
MALAARCAGVQLGRRGMRVADARRLLGASAIIGVSVHIGDAAGRAVSAGADFLLVGTLYGTETHPGAATNGLDLLRRLSGLPVPRIGIGGVTPGRVREAIDAGADGVAVVRGVWRAPSPRGALTEYLNQLRDA